MKLNDKQIHKLKLLSLVSMSSQSKILPFSDICQELKLKGNAEVEDIVLQAIFNRLISATID